jgi:hypothetical protein
MPYENVRVPFQVLEDGRRCLTAVQVREDRAAKVFFTRWHDQFEWSEPLECWILKEKLLPSGTGEYYMRMEVP